VSAAVLRQAWGGKERGASRGQGVIPGGAEGEVGSGYDFVLVEALSRRHYESRHLPSAITSRTSTSSSRRRRGCYPTSAPRSLSTA
jgi:hypothetical protein